MFNEAVQGLRNFGQERRVVETQGCFVEDFNEGPYGSSNAKEFPRSFNEENKGKRKREKNVMKEYMTRGTFPQNN